jgi:hypothetical protein
MQAQLDHLVIAASSLQSGVAWCEATLGIVPGPGGRHALMGTHNRLFSIAGDRFPQAYLEVIAIDPDAPPPGRARWFGLDRLALHEGPRLVHWVARSPNLDMQRWGLVASGLNPGETLALQREAPRGLLRWRIVVPADGEPLCGGALPALIEWQGPHPAEAMPASGVTLEHLTLRGLPERAGQVLRLRSVELAGLPGAALEARLHTPRGPVTLTTHPA